MTVTLCLSCSPGLLNQRPRGSLCLILAFFTTSYQHLLWTPNSIWVPEGPLGQMWLFLPHLVSNWLELYWQLRLNWLVELNCLLVNSSALYYLQTPMQRYGHTSTSPQFLPISGNRDVSLPLSLEWPVWSSSSGNNCHAVHSSLSSGASLWSGTFTMSHIISRAHLHNFFRLLAIGMCHFLPVHHLGIAFLGRVEGQNITLGHWWTL